MDALNVCIIGSGNLATNLAFALKNKNVNILQIYSRNSNNAKQLANNIGCNFVNEIKLLNQSADIYFLAVSDNAVAEISALINFEPELIVHTAGSVDINVFNGIFRNYGVFYPLQTFSKHKIIDFSDIPVFIESNSNEKLQILKIVASQISQKIIEINSENRKLIHLAAVFANNFTNFMCTLSNDVLKKEKLSFEILHPLLKETFEKIWTLNPENQQTGPAIRNDIKTIENHIQLLSDSPELEKIYRFVSESIINYYSKNKK